MMRQSLCFNLIGIIHLKSSKSYGDNSLRENFKLGKVAILKIHEGAWSSLDVMTGVAFN